MAGVREWINGPAGKMAGFALLLGALAVGFFIFRSVFGGSEAEDLSRNRWFVDSKTGEAYKYELTFGSSVPAPAPSGGSTGYPAELCYWTKDGKTKEDPTKVLLNQFVGKPGRTYCPDCGRLVVGHNPSPTEGSKPPPTEAEDKTRNTR